MLFGVLSQPRWPYLHAGDEFIARDLHLAAILHARARRDQGTRSGLFARLGQDVLLQPRRNVEWQGAESLQFRPNRRDQANLFGLQQQAKRPNNGKAKLGGQAARGFIVEQDEVRLGLQRQCKSLALARSQEGFERSCAEWLAKLPDLEPFGQRAARQFARDSGRYQNGRVEDLPHQVKFAEVVEGHNWAGVRDDPQLELSDLLHFRPPLFLGHVEKGNAQVGRVLDESDSRHPY
jgi:hypothetical protein